MRKNRRPIKRNRASINGIFLLRCEWEQINRRSALIGGIVSGLIAMLCVCAIGSPLYARHLFKLPAYMPASWFLFCVGGGLYFLLGWCISALCASASYVQIKERFSSIVLLVTVVVFRLMWYPLLFGALRPMLAFISLGIAVFLCFCALRRLWRVHKLGFLIGCLELIWIVWLFMVTGVVLLLN